MAMQNAILGILGAGILSLLGIPIHGIHNDMDTLQAEIRQTRVELQTNIDVTRQELQTEMSEGFRRLEERIAANGERISANGERIATLEGIYGITHPQPEDPKTPLPIKAGIPSPGEQ